jgi:hypothetical protein
MNRKFLKGLLLATLLLSTKEQNAFFELESIKDQLFDWKPWTAVSLCATSVLLYKYLSTEEVIIDIESYKQTVDFYYQELLQENKPILEAYEQSTKNAASDDLINAINHKGASHPYVKSKYYYEGEECRHRAPLLRGDSLFNGEAHKLWAYKEKIIKFYGSEEVAALECKDIKAYSDLAQKFWTISKLIRKHMLYHICKSNFELYFYVSRRPAISQPALISYF